MRKNETSVVPKQPMGQQNYSILMPLKGHPQSSVLRTEFALYRRFVAARVRGQMQYRASFVMQLFSSFAGAVFELIALLIVFGRFTTLGGWTVGEVAFLYALSSISFGTQEMLTAGFDDFSVMILQGEFDRVLVRPVTPFTQVLAADFQLRRLGRVAQGVVALVIALTHTHVAWTVGKLLYFPVVIASGVMLFAGITVLGATLTFWTLQRTEVINVFTYGGTFMSSYPISIYPQWMRRAVTFLIPLAFVSYYPGLYFLDRPDPLGLPGLMRFLAPLVSVCFFAIAWRVWEWGVRQYQSTGS